MGKCKSQQPTTDPKGYILLIKSKLDGYHSSDIAKELIQNADDAKARNIDFIIFRGINCLNQHILIDAPALAVINDGPYKDKDFNAIPKIIGGTKDADSTQVGRFGLGLKSVYHLCNLFYHFGYDEKNTSIKGALLNPWHYKKDKEPYISYNDEKIQEGGFQRLEKTFCEHRFDIEKKGGFVLWLPLADGSQDIFFRKQLTTGELNKEVFKDIPFELYLAQCNNLSTISLYEANNLEDAPKKIFEYKRNATDALWRTQDGDTAKTSNFEGTINFSHGDISNEWKYITIQTFSPQHPSLKEIKKNADWPKVPFEEGETDLKVQNHAALTLIYPEKYQNASNQLLWASFYPLEKGETHPDCWRVILHGYFLLTSDRKKIKGITDNNDKDIESDWNKKLAYELLSPMVPEFISLLEGSTLRKEIIAAIKKELPSDTESICSKNIYAHILDATGVSWRCLSRKEFDSQIKYKITLPDELHEDFILTLQKCNAPELYILSSDSEHLIPSTFIPYAPPQAIENILNLLLTKYTITYSEHNIKFIETLWIQSKKEYDVWGNWIIQLIKKGYFEKGLESKLLVELIKEYFPESKRRFCQVKLNKAVRVLCNDEIMTPELIYIPADTDFYIANSNNSTNSIKKQIEYLIAQQKKTPEINELIDLMRRDLQDTGENPKDTFFDNQCILVDEYKSDKSENKKLISYEELDKFKRQHRIFLTPSDLQKIPWLKRELALVLSEPVYMVSRETGVPEISPETFAVSILENNIIQSSKNQKIIDRLHKESTPIDENCREAIRKLICGRNAEGFEIIVLPDNNEYSFVENMQQDFPGEIIFLQAENCKHLTPALTAQLGIKSFDKDKDDFLSTLLEILLNSNHPEKHAKDIYTCLGDLTNLSDSLTSLLLKKAWIPYKNTVVALKKIFTKTDCSQDLLELKFVIEMGWHVFEEEKISEYIPAKHKYVLFELSSQLERFKSCCEKFFKGKNSFSLFNNNFNLEKDNIEIFIDNCNRDIESLKLLKILKDYKKDFYEFASIIPKIPSTNRELEILNYFNNIEKLKVGKVKKFYIEYLTSCLLEHIDLFSKNQNLLLPNRNNELKPCTEILLTSRDDGNSHQLLDKKIWEQWENRNIIHELQQTYFTDTNTPDWSSAKSAEQKLKRFFVNHMESQKARVSLFLTLLYSNEYGRPTTPIQELAKKIHPSESWGYKISLINPHGTGLFSPDYPITITSQFLSEKIYELNFCGNKCEVDMNNKISKSFFVTTPHLKKPMTGMPYWEINLQTTNEGIAPLMSEDEFENRLLNTIKEWLSCHMSKRPIQKDATIRILQQLDVFWEQASPAQISVESTCNVLKDRLPQILDVIKLTSTSDIHSLRLKYDVELQSNNIKNKADIQNTLWDKAKNDEQVGDALRNKVRENGYSNSSVLFELLQNANDAIIQALELHDRDKQQYSFPEKHIKIKYDEYKHTLTFAHDGRAMNDGGNFRQEWRFDLQNMLNFNVSYKNPQDNAQQTIGMFGLGFKSVHLISKEPQIYSKNLHFKIVNTLFPESLPKDSHTDNGVSTYFKLPLMDEVRAEEIFSKLSHIYKLIPVLCQGIESLEVEADTDFIKSYSVTYTPEIIYETETFAWKLCNNCNVLVFEAKLNYRGNEKLFSVAFCIERRNNDIYIKKFENTPFLWNTMPTQEEWQCKYVINGFFKLNPGRTHVDIQDEETLKSIEQLGEQLGKGLYVLYNTNHNVWNEHFWAELWEILSVGIDSPDNSAQAQFLRTLHCENRGLSYWTRHCNIASGGLSLTKFPLSFLHEATFLHKNYIKKELKDVILKHELNTSKFIDISRKQILKNIAYPTNKIQEINTEKDTYFVILSLLCENKYPSPEIKMSVDTFHSLRSLVDEWPSSQEKNTIFVHTQSGKLQPISEVLITRRSVSSSSHEEEFLRAALASSQHILDQRYIQNETDIKLFIKLRGRHQVTVEMLTKWILTAEDSQKSGALHYLLYGELSIKIIENLNNYKERSSWLFNFDEVKEIAQEKNYHILSRLFPERFEEKQTTYEDTTKTDSTPESKAEYIINIQQLEKEIGNRQLIEKCWPSQFTHNVLLEKLAENDTEAWCTLLLLGCLQSMGRQKDFQHRGFIEKLRSDDIPILWSEFTKDKGYKNSAVWIESLDAWFDKQTHSQKYGEWMRYFTSMYQINKYVKPYRELFINLPATIKRHGRINIEENFSIRANPDYTFAGKRWDAPPLPLKIGRFWVIRELSRLGFEGYREAGVLPYCWIPKQETLEKFGVHYESSDNHLEKHRKLIEQLKKINNNKIPHFNYNFDLALSEI